VFLLNFSFIIFYILYVGRLYCLSRRINIIFVWIVVSRCSVN